MPLNPVVKELNPLPFTAVIPGLFIVNTDPTSLTGSLSITRAVDFEQEQSFTVTLAVQNNVMGRGPLCQGAVQCTFIQTVVAEITIGDENDNLPMFAESLYSGGM